jgi:hypothetical protein
MSKPQILWAALIAATVTGCDKPAPPTSQARPARQSPSRCSWLRAVMASRREPTERLKAASTFSWLGLALLVSGAALAGETSPPPAEIRLVRTVVATVRAEGEPVSLTGHIRARTEESLAFRIDGHALRPDQKVRLLEDAQ